MSTPTPNPDVFEYDVGGPMTAILFMNACQTHFASNSARFTLEQSYAIATDGLVFRCTATGQMFDMCRIDADFIDITLDTVGATNTIATIGSLGTYTQFTDHTKIISGRQCHGLGRVAGGSPGVGEPNWKLDAASGLSQKLYIVEMDDSIFFVVPNGAEDRTPRAFHGGVVMTVFDDCDFGRNGVLGYVPFVSQSSISGVSAWGEGINTANNWASCVDFYEDAGELYVCPIALSGFGLGGRIRDTEEKNDRIVMNYTRCDATNGTRIAGVFKYVLYSRSSYAPGERGQSPSSQIQIALSYSTASTRYFIPWNALISVEGAPAALHVPVFS